MSHRARVREKAIIGSLAIYVEMKLFVKNNKGMNRQAFPVGISPNILRKNLSEIFLDRNGFMFIISIEMVEIDAGFIR